MTYQEAFEKARALGYDHSESAHYAIGVMAAQRLTRTRVLENTEE